MDTVTFQGNVLHLEGELPAVGRAAPDFSLTASDLSMRTLADYAGSTLVLLTVPSLDTPVCDREVRTFNTQAAGLSEKVRIAAVSSDLPFAQLRWCAAAGITAVQTLSDYRDHGFGKAYGVLIRELALLARAVFIIDPKGTLVYRQLVREVTEEPDYAAVLAALKKQLGE